MSVDTLKEYLSIVMDMEQSIYLQENLLSNIDGEIEQLRTPKQFNTPVKPIEPMYPEPEHHSFFFFLFFALALPFMEPLLGIGLLISTGIAADFLGVSFLAVVPTAYILGVIYYQSSKQKKEKVSIEVEYQTHMQEYYSQVKRYEKDVAKIQRQREQDEVERKAKSFFLEKQKEQVKQGLSLSKKHLQSIYDKNIVFPKYRNLVMICSLYEYICAGRFTELEGPNGAYNCLETEIRMDRIVTQLNQIIDRLDVIRQNQFMLFSAIQSSNQVLGEILDSNSRIEAQLDSFYNHSVQLNSQIIELNTQIATLQKTSALTAYQTERAQKELSYMNRMDYLSGRNDSVFWNQPPI